MKKDNWHFHTRQIHGGYSVDETFSRGIPIHPSAAFHFGTCERAANLFDLSEGGNIYSRLTNPTCDKYEQRVASLYGAVGAVATSSGMAATTATITALANAGENIVASPYLYGGTYNLFRITLRNLGIDCRIAPSSDPKDIEALIDNQTRCVFAESMGNPTCHVIDIETYAEVAHRHQVPLIIDNTFGACGYLCNPLEWGADIVVESATKWINGHGTGIGGIITDGGTFDWGNGKFPQIDGPSEGYHGMNLWETFGHKAYITRIRVDMLRDLGVTASPFDAYLNMIGLETLALRLDHEVATAKQLAQYLQQSPEVKRVSYVGLPDHPSHELAKKYFRHGGGAVLNVELNGSLERTAQIVEHLKLFANMVMIGDSISVVTHPASTTHRQLSEADLLAAGVPPTLLRISVGLEHAEDLIADFEQAFEACKI